MDRISEVTRELNRLMSLCMNLANYFERAGEETGEGYIEPLKMGYRALSRQLREGSKALIDIQELYTRSVETSLSDRCERQEMRDFLTEIFGDSEIECINDSDKEKIKKFVQEIEESW